MLGESESVSVSVSASWNASSMHAGRVPTGTGWFCADLLLSPWWIAAIVAAAVVILTVVCVFCMFLCRPGRGWGAGRRDPYGDAARPAAAGPAGNICFDSESWLACCVWLSWPRADQPYRRRRRQVYYSGSVDRPVYRGTYVCSSLSLSTA